MTDILELEAEFWDTPSMDSFRARCCREDKEGVITISSKDDYGHNISLFYYVTKNGLFKDERYPEFYGNVRSSLSKLLITQIQKRKANSGNTEYLNDR